MSGTGDVCFFEHRLIGIFLALDDHANAGPTARQMKRNFFAWYADELIRIAQHERCGGLLLIRQCRRACKKGYKNPAESRSHVLFLQSEKQM